MTNHARQSLDHRLPAALILLCLGPLVCGLASASGLPREMPESVGVDSRQLSRIDDVVAEGLSTGQMPGCVVAIGHAGKLVFLKAYGQRQIEPEKLAMSTDTVFDLASITKPVATATSIMLLVERGQVRLHDPVARHIPEFGQHGKQKITVLQLLTHQGGLIPDNPLSDYEQGPAEARKRIYALKPHVAPGSKFVYTDVGYIVLAELVHRVTGQSIAEYSRQHVFQPLGMRETGYLPGPALRCRAAATERRDDQWMVGQVHDPRAYHLGGIAGHAGLFSTAQDLAVYAQMLLGQGQYAGRRILSPQTVATMTRPHRVSSGLRGLGWDKQSGYSSNRGELFTSRAFGHGGFTGTSLWIDPGLDLFVIFLSNRLHPDGKGSVNALAGRIGTIAASAVTSATPGRRRPTTIVGTGVRTGIDVLRKRRFRPLKGRRVGLITNQTGIDQTGRSTARILHEAADVNLVSLFSPEHGLEGKLDIPVIGNTEDTQTGLPVFSLYGKTRRPTKEQLRGIDTLVFDIQDIGTRFYTYISTMGHAMQAAAEHNLRFVVLDRPNPINGVDVAGPVLDAGKESFVGFHRIAVRHGMTTGELARMFNEELGFNVQLEVIPLEGWVRDQFFDETGLIWVNPSPNMRNLNQALLYPGVGLLETTNLSVGRGTDTPFQLVGAPWLDGRRLARQLNQADLAGIRFVPVYFTPESSVYAGRRCAGVQILITDRRRLEPLRVGLEMARQLRLLFPDQWEVDAYGRLLGNQRTLQAVKEKKTVEEIFALYHDGLEAFCKRRQKHLLYQ